MQYIKGQIIRQTVLAALFAALSPTAWLKLTKLIGETPIGIYNIECSRDPRQPMDEREVPGYQDRQGTRYTPR